MDDLFSILKGANPDSPDEVIQEQAAKLSQHPEAATVMQSLTAQPNMAFEPKPMPASSFDVGVSDNTVTQNGSTPSMAAPIPSPELQPQPADLSQPTPPLPPAPTPAPHPAAAEAPVKLPEQKVPPMDLSASSKDNEARLANEKDALHKRKMTLLPGIAAGAGDAIAAGASAFGVKAPTDKLDKLMDRAKANFEESGHLFENRTKNDPNSDISKSYRQMVLQIAPEMAKQPAFQNMSAQAIGDKLPLIDTMMKAQAQKDMRELSMQQLKANKDISLGLKEDQQQDRLENQATQRLSSLRGDQSLARIESQRDGAISAYTLLQQAKNDKRPLSQAEYYDVLGQLWKARTGQGPTDAAIRDLDSKTFQGDINKAATYFTGKPAGGTTQGVLDNLLQFTKHTGELADAQHEAYMAPHLLKPAHLKDELWEPIKKTARGMKFSEAVKNAESKKPQMDSLVDMNALDAEIKRRNLNGSH